MFITYKYGNTVVEGSLFSEEHNIGKFRIIKRKVDDYGYHYESHIMKFPFRTIQHCIIKELTFPNWKNYN